MSRCRRVCLRSNNIDKHRSPFLEAVCEWLVNLVNISGGTFSARLLTSKSHRKYTRPPKTGTVHRKSFKSQNDLDFCRLKITDSASKYVIPCLGHVYCKCAELLTKPWGRPKTPSAATCFDIFVRAPSLLLKDFSWVSFHDNGGKWQVKCSTMLLDQSLVLLVFSCKLPVKFHPRHPRRCAN